MINRTRYLMFAKSDWDEFKKKVDGKNAEREKFLQKERYIQKLIEDSEFMKKDWEDSYEKIIAKQEEEREKKKNAENESRMNFYKKYLEEKRTERLKVLAQAEDFNFRQRDEPKTLLSSLMCSEALRQVEIQRDFNEKIRQEKHQEKLQDAKDVLTHFEEWKKDVAEKNRRKREKNMEISKFNVKHRDDDEKRAHEKKMELLAMEKEDIVNATKEMEMLRQHDIETKTKLREFIKRQGEESIEMGEKRRHETKVLDEMEDTMIDVYLGVSCKIKNIIKARKKQATEEKERMNELTRSRFPRKETALAASEEKRMLKAQEEYETKEIETINMKKAKVAAMMEDKRKCHEKWMQQQEEMKQTEEAQRKWEIANRFQNVQLYKDFDVRSKQMKYKQKLQYREFLDQQRNELEEKKKLEKEELYDFYHTKRLAGLKGINDKFVTYATDLIEECKTTNRPTRPLEKVLADYKAKYMAPPPKIPSRYLPNDPRRAPKNVECKEQK